MTKKNDTIKNDTITAELVPDGDSKIAEYSSYIPEFENLSAIKQRTLIAVTGNLLSEDSKTDAELAELVGVDRTTMKNHRRCPLWSAALKVIVGDIVKGTSDRAIRALFKRAEHDTAAIKVWLNMSDLWMDRTARLNVNTNTRQTGVDVPFIDTVDDVLALIGAAGWTEERIIERFRLLKSEGAF